MQTIHRQGTRLLFVLFICLQTTACSGWDPLINAKHKNDRLPDQSSTASELSTVIPQKSFPEITQPPKSPEQSWIVNAIEAKQMLEQGATLLDARGSTLIKKRLQGAIAVNWEQFSDRDSVTRGKLLENDDQLTQQLQALGISSDKPVVVFGDAPDGWGEDGRIVWMLRTLGHPQTVMVDGGFQALIEAKVPLQQEKGHSPQAGNFVIKRDLTWDIQRDDLRQKLGSDNLVIIDARQPREFNGKTPYGERRGGHLPGAINLYFRDFRGDNGQLLARQEILAKLHNVGITPETQLVVYCTAGVRSGWLTSVLVDLGFQAKNYAGSMWEWSAAPAEYFPLETH